jgi:hypothetical protein
VYPDPTSTQPSPPALVARGWASARECHPKRPMRVCYPVVGSPALP